MEKEFEDFIEQMKLPKSTFKSYQKLILRERKSRKGKEVKSIPQLQGQLLSIKEKMKKIEEKVLSVSHEGLIKKMEEERALLETLQDEVQRKMKNQKSSADNFEKVLAQTEPMFVNPIKMRKKSNFELRQLLSMVRFGGVLYYKKNQGYRTNETSDIHSLFSIKKCLNSHVVRQGDTDPNLLLLSKQDFDTVFQCVLTNALYIEAIYKTNDFYEI